jgi:hypothetical protein
MAREWKARQIPSRTSITEIARRYHACAVALGQTLGLSLAEVLTQHRESVTAIFIECGRSDLRVAAGVKLPPLAAPANGHQDVAAVSTIDSDNRNGAGDLEPQQEGEEEMTTGDTPLPTSLPSDGALPCAGAEIATLKPAQLAMLVSKVATLVHAEGAGWAPLLAALQAERTRRLAQGPRRR